MIDMKELKLPFELHTVAMKRKQSPVSRPEGASWSQFLWICEGKGVFRVRDKSFTLSKGDGIFIKDRVPCYYEGRELYTSWFSFYSTDHLINYTLGNKEYLVFRTPAFLDRATDELIRLAGGNTTTLALSAAAYSYAAELFSAVTVDRQSLTARIRDFLFAHYSDDLSLDLIADAIGIDKYALCHLYKKETGGGVINELHRIRITKAKRLLKYTDLAIEEIARACGFNDNSYFSKRFKAECLITPSEYRKKNLGEQL